MSNHLGNVIATVSDRKIGVTSSISYSVFASETFSTGTGGFSNYLGGTQLATISKAVAP